MRLDESAREMTSLAGFGLSCIHDFLESTREMVSGVGAANFSGLGEMTGFSDCGATVCSSMGEAVKSNSGEGKDNLLS
jgi:hypothetical protein